MNIATKTATRADTDILAIVFVGLLGMTILFAAGFVQADALHAVTHDLRHATGFACH